MGTRRGDVRPVLDRLLTLKNIFLLNLEVCSLLVGERFQEKKEARRKKHSSRGRILSGAEFLIIFMKKYIKKCDERKKLQSSAMYQLILCKLNFNEQQNKIFFLSPQISKQ